MITFDRDKSLNLPPPNFPLITRTAEIPFTSFKPEEVGPSIDAALKLAEAELAAIKGVQGGRTFENTMRAIDNLGLSLGFAMGIVSHRRSVVATPEWVAAYEAVLPRVTEFESKILLDEGLWRAVTEYAETPEAQGLTGERKRYLEKTLADFRRNGAELTPEKKERLIGINTDLSQVTARFAQNVISATNAFAFVTTDAGYLSGLPVSAREMARRSAASNGVDGYRFTLQGPIYSSVMAYADSRELREMMYRAYTTRCAGGEFDNIPHILRILELRREKAQILGCKDFSDLVLGDRMAKCGERAAAFVSELTERVFEHFLAEKEELLNFVKDELGISADQVQPWDVAYYVNKMRRAYHDFDKEELRPYFPLPKVMQGLFSIVERTFGISVRENKSLPTWHKDVTGYSAYDRNTEQLIGHFYADLFPRKNKRGGAWMDTFITHVTHNEPLPHVGVIGANITPPSGDTPPLLMHHEVITIFHEFGHLLHHLCSKTEIRALSMEGVALDFIEFPSKLLENWCWNRESLNLIAAHYETRAMLPDDLFEKMMREKKFRSATALLVQLGYSALDLKLHREYSQEKDGSILDYCRREFSPFSTAPLPEDYAMVASFNHLFKEPVAYGSGYYSYPWAEARSADGFSRFLAEGVMNPRIGRELRDTILSPGAAKEPEGLLADFMRREPDATALLQSLGLV